MSHLCIHQVLHLTSPPGWKRLLLADAPRQVINGLTLYSFGASEGWTTDIGTYFSGSLAKSFVIVTMLFSVVGESCFP